MTQKTDCEVLVDRNDLRPMQKVNVTGHGGSGDYSNWTFTYTDKYHIVQQGPNKLRSRLSCPCDPSSETSHTVNINGVADKQSTTTKIGMFPYLLHPWHKLIVCL
jgi:hypothetical protein